MESPVPGESVTSTLCRVTLVLFTIPRPVFTLLALSALEVMRNEQLFMEKLDRYRLRV